MTKDLVTELLVLAPMLALWRVWSRQDADALHERDRLQAEEHADAMAKRATRAETRRVRTTKMLEQLTAWWVGAALAGFGGNKIIECSAGYALHAVPLVDKRVNGILLPRVTRDQSSGRLRSRAVSGSQQAMRLAVARSRNARHRVNGKRCWRIGYAAIHVHPSIRSATAPYRASWATNIRSGKLRQLVWHLAPWLARADYEQIAYETALRLYPEWDRERCSEFFSFIATPVRRALYDQTGCDRCIVRGGGFDAPIHALWVFDDDGELWTLEDQLAAPLDVAGGCAGNHGGNVEEAAAVARLDAAREAQAMTAA